MGRKKMKVSEKVDIRLRVDASLHDRIQTAADQEGNSVAAFIRAAVVRELTRREREASE
jgi:predicted HicB family RNase H-like nuclease